MVRYPSLDAPGDPADEGGVDRMAEQNQARRTKAEGTAGRIEDEGAGARGGFAVQSIEDLIGDPRNPRDITMKAIAGLSSSVEKFGDLSGIVWNARTGHLVAGHQRIAVLRSLGADLVRDDTGVAVVNPKTGERFPVRVVDWPEAKARAALMTANNAAIQGMFTADAAALLAELAGTSPMSMDDLDLSDLCLDDLGEVLDRQFGPPPTRAVEFKDAEAAASKTDHCCPKCGYEWSGPCKPGGSAGGEGD